MMSVVNPSLKYLIAFFAVVILAVAPAVLRSGTGHPRWALSRLGSRPVEEDPGRELKMNVKRLGASLLDDAVSTIFIANLIGVLAVLSQGVFLRRAAACPSDERRVALSESGLCACWSDRAPPLA
jgi:hypothetical protein